MGYTTDITNRVDGKKYLISTAADKNGRGWQTAVLKYWLFGIPNLLRPAMFIGAPDEEHARQVHACVEKIVAELPIGEWESAKWKLFEGILEEGFPEVSDPSSRSSSQTHEDSQDMAGEKIASSFRGLQNTEEVIREKASVIAQLIEVSYDTGIDCASALKEAHSDLEVQVGEEQARLARAETAAVLLQIVDKVAFGILNPEQRNTLMDELEACVATILDSNGVPSSKFLELLSERHAEYAPLPIWADEEDMANSMLWEYTKKIKAIVNIEKDLIFAVSLSNLLLRAVERWELRELLSGEM